MKKIYFIPLLIFFFFSAKAQIDYGTNWVMGCSQANWDITYTEGVFVLDFRHSPVKVSNLQPMSFCNVGVSAATSDSAGNLRFFSAGISVLNNVSYTTIYDGYSLPENDAVYDISYPIPQSLLFLPMPNHPDSVLLFFTDYFEYNYPPTMQDKGGCKNLTWSIIDNLGNNGKGEMVQRLSPLIVHDTLTYGQLTAIRHANGRDWWVLSARDNSDQYYRFLVTPNGVEDYGIQDVGGTIYPGLGQACFSPDGAWYARYNLENPTVGAYLDVYSFDRCSGELDNHITIKIASGNKPGGVSVSPNSRFLYVSSFEQIYQFDLWAADLEASKVLVASYDGHTSLITPGEPNPIYTPSRFYLMQLANNGKIYISVPFTTSNVLHTIENPDVQGLACDVQQHSFYWPKRHSFGLPNMPNHALGALADSPCDSLGLSSAQQPNMGNPTVLVFPNPASAQVTFKLENFNENEKLQVRLFNALGEVVKTDFFTQSQKIGFDVSALASGLYFFTIQNRAAKIIDSGTLSVQH